MRRKEYFSATLETELRVLERDLNRVVCSASCEDEPIEMLRFLVRPDNIEVTRLIVPVSVLNREFFSAIVVDEPIMSVKDLGKLRAHELARPSEPLNDRKSDDFSLKADAKVKEPVSDLKRAVCLARPIVVEREPARDLNKEVFSAKPVFETSEAVNARNREACLERLVAVVSEELNALKRVFFSARPEDKPIEALKPLARPLV